MAAFLGNLRNVVIAGFVLALLVFLVHAGLNGWAIDWSFHDGTVTAFLVRWLHIASGVMWIGLLWYFNFVSTPTMPRIPDDLKPALGRFITPAALWWFRWGAMSTIVFGIILAAINGYLLEAYSLGFYENGAPAFSSTTHIIIGIGMWLATIMWFNVWFIIWPNQQKALNIDNAFPDLPADQKAAAARTAGQFSRINTLLSIPMLFCMAAATHWP